MNERQLLKSTVSEYESLLHSLGPDGGDQLDADRLVAQLSHSHDWTRQGAEEIVWLANAYGAFMLRNALALALALKKEDGDLRY
jgi:hypothetical protein